MRIRPKTDYNLEDSLLLTLEDKILQLIQWRILIKSDANMQKSTIER